MKHFCSLLLLMLLPMALLAQKVKKVEGEFTYEGNETQSLAECKRMALEGARLNALAREFGTTVSQDIIQQESTGTSDSSFFDALSSTKVKGEWIADDGDPIYEISHTPAGNPLVKCKIKGRARELSNDAVEFTIETMRNGSDSRYASTEFRDQDHMTLAFRAPVDGYVAVFLHDDAGNTFTLLPYRSNRSGQVKVKGNQDYVFFSSQKSVGPDEPDEMILLTDREAERNVLQVVFSPNPFTRPNDHGGSETMPRMLSRRDFNRWLTDRQSGDKRLSTQSINLVIKK